MCAVAYVEFVVLPPLNKVEPNAPTTQALSDDGMTVVGTFVLNRTNAYRGSAASSVIVNLRWRSVGRSGGA